MPDLLDALPSFFFAKDTNDPRVNQALRQRIAMQIMASNKRPYPKNAGEGLTAIGDAIGDRGMMNQLMSGDLAQQDAAKAAISRLNGGGVAAPQYASTGDVQTSAPALPPVTDKVDAEGLVDPSVKNSLDASSDYRPAPAYLKSSLDRLIQDPTRRGYLGHLAGGEAQSPTEISSTGAAGPFQFTRGTGRQYGLMGAGGDQRTNIDASILAANKLTDDNVATLTAKLGRAPTPGEMALAHQQGAVTASRMLTGTGNAPANNLAVNNVNPGASPQVAAAKIMGYYGMPGSAPTPRDRIAATLAARQSAPGVPQPNPTLAGAEPPSASAMPLGGDNSQANAFAGLPPEITTGASAFRAAPAQQPQIRSEPPPVQVAQAGNPYATQPPVAPERSRMSPAEAQMRQMIRDNPNNPYIAQQLADPLAQLEATRTAEDARRIEQYKSDLQNFNALDLKAREYRANTPQRNIELGQKQSEAELKATEARIVGRTGMLPTALYERYDKDKAAVDQTIQAQSAQQLARKAIRDGVITGYGANGVLAGAKFADWAWKNGLKGDLAANTEIMSSALKFGLGNAIETINGVGGKVSDSDLKIAQGMQATDPTLQMKTIQTIMDRAAKINFDKINTYEGKLQQDLGGEPAERRYTPSLKALISDEHAKLLEDSQGTDKAAKAKADFDEYYGPGAADFALARAKRRMGISR